MGTRDHTRGVRERDGARPGEMTLRLRPYQESVVAEAAEMLEARGSCLIAAPTGAGKTAIAAALMELSRIPI